MRCPLTSKVLNEDYCLFFLEIFLSAACNKPVSNPSWDDDHVFGNYCYIKVIFFSVFYCYIKQ